MLQQHPRAITQVLKHFVLQFWETEMATSASDRIRKTETQKPLTAADFVVARPDNEF